jgi:hypothetical protein
MNINCKGVIVNNTTILLPKEVSLPEPLEIKIFFNEKINTFEKNRIEPVVCFLNFNKNEKNSKYILITYNPFTGEQFRFTVDEIIDVSNTFNNLQHNLLNANFKKKLITEKLYKLFDKQSVIYNDYQEIPLWKLLTEKDVLNE